MSCASCTSNWQYLCGTRRCVFISTDCWSRSMQNRYFFSSTDIPEEKSQSPTRSTSSMQRDRPLNVSPSVRGLVLTPHASFWLVPQGVEVLGNYVPKDPSDAMKFSSCIVSNGDREWCHSTLSWTLTSRIHTIFSVKINSATHTPGLFLWAEEPSAKSFQALNYYARSDALQECLT